MFDSLATWLVLPLGIALGWYMRGRSPEASDDAPTAEAMAGMGNLVNDDPDQALSALLRANEFDSQAIELHLTLGILFRKRRQLPLTAVEFVQVKPCLFGQAVDSGTVIVHGTGGVSLTLRQMAHPHSAQRAIQRALNATPRERDGGASSPLAPQPIAA